MPPPQALALARTKGLDLVEISPTAVPPVCRIMDFGKYQYEQQKRALDRNTRNAYQTLVQGISEVEARRLAVVSAQSAYDASQVGLEVGTRTVLDVIQNQRILFSAQLDYAQARYTFLQNRLLLSQSLGALDVAELQDVNRLLTQDAGNPATTTH